MIGDEERVDAYTRVRQRGGRGTGGKEGDEGRGSGFIKKKTRVGEVGSLLEWSRQRMREEVKCFAKNHSSTSRLEQSLDE